MKKFDYEEIVGHSLIVRKLRQAVTADRVVSAYLFCGSPGIGKKSVASVFAASLLCQSPREGNPCHTCASCRLLESGNHPDYITLSVPEDKKSIGVEQVREEIVKEAFIRPFHAGKKVFVIPNSEVLTDDAQNALLKILEEPPLYAVFLLLTPTADRLLQTVLSRCLKIQLLPLSDKVCHGYFDQQPGDSGRKELAASFAQGNIGKGLTMLNDEAYYQLYQETISELAAIPEDKGMLPRMQNFLFQHREQIDDITDFIMIFLRDCMRRKISNHTKMICTDRQTDIERFARAYSPGGLVRTMEAVVMFRKRLLKNANFTAAGLELLTKMQEEIHG